MDNYQLIDKVLAGQASESEKAQLEAWLAANPENQQYHDDIKFLLDAHEDEPTESNKKEKGWQKIQAAISADKRKRHSNKMIRSLRFIVFFSTALLTTGYLAWKISPASSNSAFATGDNDSVSFHWLADSSIVALSGNSSYRYINGWDTAILEITGRAYLLSIATGKPVVVKTQSMSTAVHDASLFITSLPGEQKFYLEKGNPAQVKFKTQRATLSQGLSADSSSGHLQIHAIDLNQEFWYLHELAFVKTPLNEVIAQLKKNIGITIHAEFDLSSCNFSGAFTNSISEQEVINALCDYYDLRYERAGPGNYTLIGTPCQKP